MPTATGAAHAVAVGMAHRAAAGIPPLAYVSRSQHDVHAQAEMPRRFGCGP